MSIGLDIDKDRVAKTFPISKTDDIISFIKLIIDNTNDLCIAYKFNMAFYEFLGVDGLKVLERLVSYTKNNYPDILLICDAKRADIGNTSSKYANAYLKNLPFDAITLSPYMGVDSIMPFIEDKDKWAIILALTSNDGHRDFQLIKSNNGLYLFEEIIIKFNNLKKENIMFVIGATKPEYLKNVRNIDKNSFLLIPGVGVQGGDINKVCENGINRDIGMIINSSRSIIYPKDGFSITNIRKEAMNLKKVMENFL